MILPKTVLEIVQENPFAKEMEKELVALGVKLPSLLDEVTLYNILVEDEIVGVLLRTVNKPIKWISYAKYAPSLDLRKFQKQNYPRRQYNYEARSMGWGTRKDSIEFVLVNYEYWKMDREIEKEIQVIIQRQIEKEIKEADPEEQWVTIVTKDADLGPFQSKEKINLQKSSSGLLRVQIGRSAPFGVLAKQGNPEIGGHSREDVLKLFLSVGIVRKAAQYVHKETVEAFLNKFPVLKEDYDVDSETA